MAPPDEFDDDARHRKEEAERRAKRKASKMSKSKEHLERERKRKAHRDKILKGGSSKSAGKSAGTSEEAATSSFQRLFTQQGFQVEFRFRNAPPRPPVGPCFIGLSLDGALQKASQYQPLNAVEVNYTWRLHNEPDLGVPLAPSAMDLKSYESQRTPKSQQPLHPDDEALLNWKGSMGDTAAEQLKKRKDHARALARLALAGKAPHHLLAAKASSNEPTLKSASSKKAFSRVLDETMQSWMKKTTYLSNDHSRKVHDFKSLAKTKQDIVQDLEQRQQEINKMRSAQAISQTFEKHALRHPTKKNIKPVAEMPLLPNVQHWGQAYTHAIMDKSPGKDHDLDEAFVANVEKKDANARMSCQLYARADRPNDEEDEKEEAGDRFEPIREYDLDVIPLKEEDAPHVNFCIWIDPDKKSATYLPISSRVQLSTGRPSKKNVAMIFSRRSLTDDERHEVEDRIAEVDLDTAERLGKQQPVAETEKPTEEGLAVHDHTDDDEDDHDF